MKGQNITIRPETAADHESIRQVNSLAFGQDAEAQLVDALRDGGFVQLSLVAELDGRVVGHVLFSDIQIVGNDNSVDALALAPMAVVPEHQHRGIGSDLIQTGLDQCRQAGHQIVIVVGAPKLLSSVRIFTRTRCAVAVAVRRRGIHGAGACAGSACRRDGRIELPTAVCGVLIR